MMLPGQIKNYAIPATKQGTYKASDVEAFRQKVYAAFCEVVSENNALKEKFVSLSDLVNEYNAGKNSIAKALIKSQTLADETVSDAEKKAEQIIADAEIKAQNILSEKTKEADEYVASKTAKADEYYEKAETELEKAMKAVSEKADEYVAEVNAKATEIITKANEQASKIVSRAYADAKKARETCDDIINSANNALPEISADVESFKAQTLKLLTIMTQAVDSISVPKSVEVEVSNDSDDEIETFEETELPVFSFETEQPKEDEIQNNAENEAEKIIEVLEEPAESSAATDYIFDKFSAFDDLFSSLDDETENTENASNLSDDSEDKF